MPECPPIPNLEDLATPDEIAAALKIAKSSLMPYRFGRTQATGTAPILPYIRFGNTIYFSKTQVAWWLNEYQVWSSRRFDDQRVTRSRLAKASYKPRRKPPYKRKDS